jgi:hypothetical protein
MTSVDVAGREKSDAAVIQETALRVRIARMQDMNPASFCV